MDVRRDGRVLSLVGKAGLKGQLTTMLEQLQRCQKALNEFLEVSPFGRLAWSTLISSCITSTRSSANGSTRSTC